MVQFSANLSFLFPNFPFIERFTQAAKAGFTGVEYMGAYDESISAINEKLDHDGLKVVLFNAPPGDWEAGERGLAAMPGAQDRFKHSIERAIDHAEKVGAPRIHIMAGLRNPDMLVQEQTEIYVENLKYAADQLASVSLRGTIEPINPFDMPGYFLTHLDQALSVLKAVGKSNIRLQFDCYHAQIMGGNLINRLESCLHRVEHVQIAGVPRREDPNQGEVNYQAIFDFLDQQHYGGWVGCEYRPSRPQDGPAGFGWMHSARSRSQWRR